MLVMIVSLALSACGELGELPTDPGGGDPLDPSATFSRVQAEIFTPRCTTIGCHDSIGRSQGLVLEAGVSYANLVNRASTEISQVDLIEPGEPDASYLFWKVTGRQGILNDRMPLFATPLSEGQIALLRNWILRGAPND